MKRRFAAAVAVLALAPAGLLASCSDDGSGTEIDPDYAEFCFLATDLLTKSQFSHTPDPAALKTLWDDISRLFADMTKAAPLEIAGAVGVLADNWEARKKIFETYNYNIIEMSEVPEVETELDALTTDEKVVAANDDLSKTTIGKCNVQP